MFRKVLVAMFVLMLVPAFVLAAAKKEQLQPQDIVIKAQVKSACNLLQEEYLKYKKGKLTLAEAKKRGADRLRELRYGDKKDGYFFADTLKGVNVVLPVNRKIEGTNRAKAKMLGVSYVKEIKKSALQKGGGFTEYFFPKMGGKEPLPKRSYSLVFKPFGWVVGTGYYLDDVK